MHGLICRGITTRINQFEVPIYVFMSTEYLLQLIMTNMFIHIPPAIKINYSNPIN